MTEADISYMAELGYNSVRIPFNWRILMEEGPGVVWKEKGFQLLDRCLDWCREAGIYAFLDLHGAPGGQTGANIDDCIDNVPRLFTDRDSREKALALWRMLAVRYKNREEVGGYDLLNEPIAPAGLKGTDNDYLIPELEKFYEDAIALIREVDQVHLLSLEGPHWAADPCIFHKKYDNNMVLHFHRYAEIPERRILDEYLKKSQELDIPLWLGETGENVNEWFAALYPLAASYGIGYNLWPWKKMDCTNSPCSIPMPEDYQLILDYIDGGAHPGYAKAQSIWNEYLFNVKLENCTLHPEVTRHTFRQIPFALRAADFDELPGKGISYSGTAKETEGISYRKGCGMCIRETALMGEKKFAFDCGWERFALVLKAGEFAEYSFQPAEGLHLHIELQTLEDAQLEICGKEISLIKGCLSAEVSLTFGEVSGVVRISCHTGTVLLERLVFQSESGIQESQGLQI